MLMTRLPLPLAVVASALLVACGERGPAPAAGDGAARVGEAVLSDADLAQTLGALPAGLDSAAARREAIERWTERELLVQEARRVGLDREPGVARRLADAERATLEAVAMERLFANVLAAPSDDAVARYYAAHRDALALREPYVRLRHLRVPPSRADDATAALTAAAAYVPESRLQSLDAALGARIADLSPGPRAVAVASGDAVHVVQLVDRVAAGTVPPLAVVQAELTERLAIDLRRDTEAQAIERLRAEAVARGDL